MFTADQCYKKVLDNLDYDRKKLPIMKEIDETIGKALENDELSVKVRRKGNQIIMEAIAMELAESGFIVTLNSYDNGEYEFCIGWNLGEALGVERR